MIARAFTALRDLLDGTTSARLHEQERAITALEDATDQLAAMVGEFTTGPVRCVAPAKGATRGNR